MTYRYISPGFLLLLCLYSSQANADSSASAPRPPAVSAMVQTSTAKLNRMSDSMTVYGTVEYAPEQSRVLDVQGEGIINKVMVAAGQKVRKGDALLELTATVNAKTELENAQIAVKFARKDLQRLRDLRTRQLATNLDVQTAEETLAKAETAFSSAHKRQGGGNVRVLRAEMDGIVDQVNVRQGEIAAAGAPLIRLAKGDQLRVRLGVEAEDLSRLHDGLLVHIMPLHHGAQPSSGRIQQIYRQIDPKTRLAEIVVTLPSAPGLFPGAMVKGEIVLAQQTVLTVPRSAVLSRNGKNYVFLAKDMRATLRWVETGNDNGSNIEIRRGLNAGDVVVSLGNYELENGMALRVQEQHP